MSLASSTTGLAVTNPLVLYRSFLALKRIDPDPAQHRLALHLQKLYNRLLDYEPQIEYSHRLEELSRTIRGSTNISNVTQDASSSPSSPTSGIFSFGKKDEGLETLALTRKLTDYEAAMQIDSPQGLLLHGEVGTGKSMLIDMLARSLPGGKKRRWHFNTFMLEIFARIEKHRRAQLPFNDGHDSNDYPLLVVARDLISTSPVLFLDEFQLPDRAASKILSNLLTSFFHLGGVLIATSNRMPEELVNAAGTEFTPPPLSQPGLFGNRWRFFKQYNGLRPEKGKFSSGGGDFATFLEVLRARCEVWQMEGTKDWRRHEVDGELPVVVGGTSTDDAHMSGLEQLSAGSLDVGLEQSRVGADSPESQFSRQDRKIPYRYILSHLEVTLPSCESLEGITRRLLNAGKGTDPEAPIPWAPATLRLYGRNLFVPRTLSGITRWTFEELCCSNFGPADYITLASTYHTFILTEVPVLTFLHRNEARRFITLLDAMYEAKCKLIIQASAGPDELFFPDTCMNAKNVGDAWNEGGVGLFPSDATLPETFSEIYQDTTSPFRPNVSSYESTASQPSYKQPNRSMLADEDSDFGPTYGAGRNASRGPSNSPPGTGNEMGRQIDFNQTGTFTGEDEKFAYKRARSRLWEMCGRKWWARNEEGWWQPLTEDARHWEGNNNARQADIHQSSSRAMSSSEKAPSNREKEDAKLFRHGASPFRTSTDPPPKIGWTHAWGMMRWGKKAGTWGKGVGGLGDRKEVEDGDDERRKF